MACRDNIHAADLNLNLNQQLTVRIAHVCVCVLCTIVVHNTAQSSNNLPSYLPDSHRSSDAVYWRGRKTLLRNK